MRVDLHTHSRASDGTLTPSELMAAAAAAHLDVIGLTDHDTTSGWDEAVASLATLARPLGIALGAEISCHTDDGISVHLVGLLFDRNDVALTKTLETSRDDRIPRMHAMIGKLNAAGIDVTFADVERETSYGATLGRPHLADALVGKGVVASRDAAFADLLGNDSPFYVGHLAPTPVQAIELVKAAGGVAILAHPGAGARGRTVNVAAIEEMAGAGLDALEVDHRDHDDKTRDELRGVAAGLGLLVTGSSDYHGAGKLNLLGENLTSEDAWIELARRAYGNEVRFA